MRRRNVVRGLLVAGATAAGVLLSAAASADEREQCAAAADQAQQLRDEGKYRGARERLLVCARDACPGFIKKDCLEWLGELDRDAPSVVVTARDGDKDVVDVKVFMDDVALADRLDGRPLPVDLGEHAFRFEHGGVTKEQRVLISAGQKSRNIAVDFGAAAAAAPAPAPAPARKDEPEKADVRPRQAGSVVPALVVGSVGVMALGTAVVFGLQGKSDVDRLQDCKPRCAESDVDSARTKLIVSDISTGVGLVALGVAAYMFFTRAKEPDVGAAARAGLLRDVRFDATPVAGGGAASFSGAF